MKGIIFQGKESVAYEAVADPKIEKPTDAIIEIALSGLCGSDLHPYHLREKGLDPGTVMGHEAVGTVIESGKDCALKKGDRILVPFTTSCGQCRFCEIGLTARCLQGELFGWREKGSGLHGLQAPFARIPLADTTGIKIPEGISDELALLLGDVFSTGYFAANLLEPRPNEFYAVVGAGPVGLMTIASLKLLNVDTIYSIDLQSDRLAMASTLGAQTIHATESNPIAQIQSREQGCLPAGVVEAVGSTAAQTLAFDLVRVGGTLATVGVHTEKAFAFSPSKAYDKNLTYRTGRCSAHHWANQLIEKVSDDPLGVTKMISHRLPFEEGQKAYQLFDKKLDGCLKLVFAEH